MQRWRVLYRKFLDSRCSPLQTQSMTTISIDGNHLQHLREVVELIIQFRSLLLFAVHLPQLALGSDLIFFLLRHVRRVDVEVFVIVVIKVVTAGPPGREWRRGRRQLGSS